MARHAVGDRIDRYEVLGLLGEGAYGETYKARDDRTGELVVVKSPHPNLLADPGVFQRFRRETEIAKALHHPGIQGGRDLAEHRSEPYLVLEYVEGETLRDRVRQAPHGRVPVEQVVAWGRQLADALAYVHAHGVVHRDLKPENLLVTADGQLKIADFGTALLEGARRLTFKHLSESIGTPDYMSPEQVQGGRGDQRSDLYSWGVIMYELLAGRPPFRGDNWMAVMAGHLTGTPEPLTGRSGGRHGDVPAALDAVVRKAMRRHPENRYTTAAELVADLDRLDELDPASFDLGPEAPIGGMAAIDSERRLWRFIALVAVAFIAVVALVIGLSVALR